MPEVKKSAAPKILLGTLGVWTGLLLAGCSGSATDAPMMTEEAKQADMKAQQESFEANDAAAAAANAQAKQEQSPY